jgi:hypothetical protein
MANYYGNFEQQIWLACGGLQHLSLDAMQPLIDQWRTVWLWPDKDGAEKWQELAERLGYEKVRVYTHFFDSCWREADGDKADVADIAIRMMRTGEGPREAEAAAMQRRTEQGEADENTQGEAEVPWEGFVDADDDTPFMDMDEMADPRVRAWREVLRQKYNFNKTRRHDDRQTT